MILGYPEGLEGYTYGETSAKCWELKEEGTRKVQELKWDNGILTNSEGKETSYTEIRQETEKEIETVRTSYREDIYNKQIEEYINTHHSDIAKEEWIEEIKL